MKILAIGDPHGSLKKIRDVPKKDVDLILVTGDLGKADLARKMAFENVARKKRGLPEGEFSQSMERRAFTESYNSSVKVVRYLAKFAPVFVIYGNVELGIDRDEARRLFGGNRKSLPFLTDSLKEIPGVRIINNRLANFQGVRIGGLKYFTDTNWVRDFKPSDYREKMRKARKETDNAKKVLGRFGGVDILICHQPPYGVLDKVGKFAPKHWRGKHAGSKSVLSFVRKCRPKYVFCGHIHEGEGVKNIGKTEVYNLGVGGYKVVEF
jgi:Icc-related predicted phosphoesterase